MQVARRQPTKYILTADKTESTVYTACHPQFVQPVIHSLYSLSFTVYTACHPQFIQPVIRAQRGLPGEVQMKEFRRPYMTASNYQKGRT